ncbi:MAG: hypothetical protein ABIH52_00815 [Candidatus Aenigmatarchaeota archaeon]|nr:hypothetical protein [Nanoarchaeota archaeon]
MDRQMDTRVTDYVKKQIGWNPRNGEITLHCYEDSLIVNIHKNDAVGSFSFNTGNRYLTPFEKRRFLYSQITPFREEFGPNIIHLVLDGEIFDEVDYGRRFGR